MPQSQEKKCKQEKSPARKLSPAGPLFFSGFDLHSARQGEGDLVLAVYRHAVNQTGPLSLVELGVKLRQSLDGFDEPLQLPPAHHPLADLVGDGIPLFLGFLIPADQGVVAFSVLRLLLRRPSVLRDEVVHRLGVHGELLVEQPLFLLQLTVTGGRFSLSAFSHLRAKS